MIHLKKENRQETNKFSFDYKNYSLFLKKSKELAKECEFNSNTNNLNYYVTLNGIKRPYMNCRGICSRTFDMEHVGFFDWDNALRWIVEEEINLLIKDEDLTPFYLFATKEEKKETGELYGNYIGICLQKKTLWEWLQLSRRTSTDIAHRLVAGSYAYKTSVIRLSNKGKKDAPIFIGIIGESNKEYSQDISQAHLNILKGIYHIPDVSYLNSDKSNKIFTVEYQTASE